MRLFYVSDINVGDIFISHTDTYRLQANKCNYVKNQFSFLEVV